MQHIEGSDFLQILPPKIPFGPNGHFPTMAIMIK